MLIALTECFYWLHATQKGSTHSCGMKCLCAVLLAESEFEFIFKRSLKKIVLRVLTHLS